MQSSELFPSQLKHEVARESILIALHRLHEGSSFDAVKLGEIAAQHDLLPTQNENAGCDLF
jgi:hypothetical protein